jgi:nucleotide-binding universal stress UspA family protein
MTNTILVAVRDSPAAFMAAEIAVDYARRLGADLHAVAVVENGELRRRLEGTHVPTGHGELAATAALRHVAAMCASQGVPSTSTCRTGQVAAEILEESRVVGASLIVLAQADRPGHALPYIGSQTLRVLEFATVPVLVVPVRRDARGTRPPAEDDCR